jgi:hypothetical protein
VLLARLQGEHVAAPALAVDGLADDPPRQPPDVRAEGGQEAVVRPAVGEEVARRLPFPDGDLAAQVAGCLEQPERHRVDVRDRHRAGGIRHLGQIAQGLQAAEEVGLREGSRRRRPGRPRAGRRAR